MRAPAGRHIRPTADRIKESLFNILAGSIRGTRVLDLFAGTGALGIEALSRGAASAVFVDQAPAALATIRRNLEDLGLGAQARIIRWNIRNNLGCLLASAPAFDLVFMDPPYAADLVAPTLDHLLSCGVLSPTARIVIEHSAGETVNARWGQLDLADCRRFGKTLVSFMHPVI